MPNTTPRSKPVVYLSFAPGDEKWADRTTVALHCLGHQERVRCWDVRQISSGADEAAATRAAIANAALGLLLVSMRFLSDTRIKDVDVPALLRRRDADKLMVVPVLVSPCPWKTSWLRGMQMFPKDGYRALSGGDEHDIDTDLTELAYIVNDALPPADPAKPESKLQDHE